MKLDFGKVKTFGRSAVRFLIKNSPAILEGLSIGGYLASVALSVDATVKATKRVDEAEAEKGEKLTVKEVVKEVWPLFIPTVCTTLAATACGYASLHESNRRNASLAAGYGFYEAAYTELNEKAEKYLSKKKVQDIKDEIAEERINGESWDQKSVVITNPNAPQLFIVELTGQKFNSDVHTVRQAINDFNHWWNLEEGYGSNMYSLDEPCVSLNEILSYIRELNVDEDQKAKLGDEWFFRYSEGLIEEDLSSTAMIKSGPYAGQTAVLLKFRNKAYPAAYLMAVD